MSEGAECIHGMEFGCTICSGKDKPRKQTDEIEFTFTAKYGGHCSPCNLPIHKGQRAAKLVSGRVVHENCVKP